ncbi:MAG: serine hydrolase domain-containing protein [Acetivibrionales bacterium]|jgi:CubicO group peptidase (beta-lactamase class C family)
MFKKFLTNQIENGAFPGAALLVYKDGEIIAEEYLGKISYDCDMKVNKDTRYDLASVTKVFTSVCIALLLEKKLISLKDPASKYLPELKGDGKEAITIEQLCTHTAGLFGEPELHKQIPDSIELYREFFNHPLKYNPSEQFFYTSVGYQFLGYIIERVSGMHLHRFMKKYIFEPLNLKTVSFNPEDKANISPTEFSIFRNRICHGEVHDDNCFVLGGVCGHAGLFATAYDVAQFGNMLLNNGDKVFKDCESLEPLFHNFTEGKEQNRSIAFAINSPGMGNWSCNNYSHTGFTGTSLFLVPKHRVVAVLLTNRVCPTRENEQINEARLGLHSLLARMLGEENS